MKERDSIMRESNYHWEFMEKDPMPDDFLTKYPLLNQLLWNRGIRNEEEAHHFLNPKLDQINDPFMMYDMEKAVHRILKAIEHGESILIYGDYDCDGITSASVLKEAIEALGGEPQVYIPNRFDDGYGPNIEVYKYFIDMGTQLIITVDNGVTGFEAIEYATKHNIDVIVTDHHQMKEELPNAYAIIHPRHPKGEYPFKDLAGVGVAFKVATALLGYIPTELIDLVTIGTIADLVSLTGENRVIVSEGLKFLQKTDRIGLQKLFNLLKIDPLNIDEETISFQIAPRLNALGRLGDAMIGVELLTTFDEEEAQEIVNVVEETNNQRKLLVEKTVQEAQSMIQNKRPYQFLYQKDWNEGILGIVASRITEQTQTPTFVLSYNETTNSYKGSARSTDNINLFNLLKENQAFLNTFGGHDKAAGLSVDEENIPLLLENLNQWFAKHDTHKKSNLMIDSILEIDKIDVELVQALQKLSPFGTDNPKPLFIIHPTQVKNIKLIGSNNTTIKAELLKNNQSLEILGFNYYDSQREWLSSNQLEIVGSLQINEWNGQKKVQMRLKDYKIDGIQIFDGRMQRILEEDFMNIPSVFVYFNPYHRARLEKMFPNQKIVDAESFNDSAPQIVITDIPVYMSELTTFIQKHLTNRYVLMVRAFDDALLNGMPTRENFVDLMHFIQYNSNIDVVHRLQDISQFVKIPMQNLIFMINLFKDLGFVTISGGIMNKVDVKEKKALNSSPLYQERESLIENESFLLYSDLDTLKEWFQKQGE